MTMVLRAKPLSDVVRGIIKRDNGCWLDASDLSTMYQNAAGTIPVTAMEQPVGLWLDKSGNGNHATQSITASRPVISARKNLLLSTDTLSTQSVATVAELQTLSFTGTGSIALSGTGTGTLTGTGANNRVSLAFTPTAGTLTITVTGDVRLAQLEYGPTATTYQRVNTATDYDTDERYFKKYLRFDGVDDYLSLPYMGLYANGSASAIFCIDNIPSTREKVIVSETRSGTTIPLYILAKLTPNTNLLGFKVRNDSLVTLIDQAVIQPPANSKCVITAKDGGSSITGIYNSTTQDVYAYSRSGVITLNSTTIGAVNFPGVSTTSLFDKNLYGLIITKSAISDADRRKCEVYLGRKAGVQL